MTFTLSSFALHELYQEDGGTMAAALGLGLAGQDASGRPFLWVRHRLMESEVGGPCPQGFAEWGLDPGRVILVRSPDAVAALQAGLEGARTPGLGAVMIDLWGEARPYDLTASRRLVLAAKASGARVIVTRMAARPHPSAAETRWRLRTLPSRPLAAGSPGPPAFELTLLRARNGQEGGILHLEWNRDERRFAILRPASDRQAEPCGQRGATPLSGLVAAFPADRPTAPPVCRTG